MRSYMMGLCAALLAATVTIAGCERGPNLKVLNSFDKDSVSFSYPKNWKITGDSKLGPKGQVRLILVEGSANEVATITIVPGPGAMSLDEYADTMTRERAKEANNTMKVGSFQTVSTSESKRSPVKSEFGGRKYEGLAEEFSVAVLGQAVPHRATYYLREEGETRIFLVAQAATDSFKAAEPGFGTIFSTLKVPAAAPSP